MRGYGTSSITWCIARSPEASFTIARIRSWLSSVRSSRSWANGLLAHSTAIAAQPGQHSFCHGRIVQGRPAEARDAGAIRIGPARGAGLPRQLCDRSSPTDSANVAMTIAAWRMSFTSRRSPVSMLVWWVRMS